MTLPDMQIMTGAPTLSAQIWRWCAQPGKIALLDQAIVSGVNFLTGILLARFLGLEAYGAFTLLWMAVLFINSFQMALILSPMMSIGSKQSDDVRAGYYGAVLVQQLVFAVGSTLLLLLALAATAWLHPEWHIAAYGLPLAAVSIAFQCQEFVRRYFFTRSRPLDALLNDGISYLGQLAALFGCYVLNQVTVSAVLWVIAATSGLAVGAGLLRIGEIRFQKAEWPDVIRRHFEFSKWLTASTLLTWLSGNLMLIVAGSVLGTVVVGILKACQNIVAVLHILFNALANTVPVRAGALLSQKGLSGMERYLARTTLIGAAVTILAALPVLLFPEMILQWIYGQAMEGSGWLLAGYAVLYLLMFPVQMLTFALRALEKTRPIFEGYLLSALVSLLIAWPAARWFGPAGVVCGLIVLMLLNGLVLARGYQVARRESWSSEVIS